MFASLWNFLSVENLVKFVTNPVLASPLKFQGCLHVTDIEASLANIFLFKFDAHCTELSYLNNPK